MVLAQHGLLGQMQTPIDLSYLSDAVIMLRYFEAGGRVRRALSVVKKRSGKHEDTIREFQLTSDLLSQVTVSPGRDATYARCPPGQPGHRVPLVNVGPAGPAGPPGKPGPAAANTLHPLVRQPARPNATSSALPGKNSFR